MEPLSNLTLDVYPLLIFTLKNTHIIIRNEIQRRRSAISYYENGLNYFHYKLHQNFFFLFFKKQAFTECT